MALEYAEYGYVMENGRVVLDGVAETLRDNADVKRVLLRSDGGGQEELPRVESSAILGSGRTEPGNRCHLLNRFPQVF